MWVCKERKDRRKSNSSNGGSKGVCVAGSGGREYNVGSQ